MSEHRKVFIIAEAGVNHDGNVETAKRMVLAAREAGACAVKFQSFKAENVVIPGLRKTRYQIKNTPTHESQFEMLKRLELSKSAFKELMLHCIQQKITFMSSPFDEESVDFLDGLGMEIFKIPSGEITNKPLIQHIATKEKPILLSTGMSYLEEVKKAIGWINEIWEGLNKKPQLTLLHCVSNYPAEAREANLTAIKTLEKTFGLPAGYSDHTLGIEIALAAVAMGARVIEKHFTLDKNMDGPDHKASLNPDELKAMIAAIRNVERAFGDGVKIPAKSEEEPRNSVRRSLVAARDIKRGSTIKRSDIAIKRPGTGLPPESIDHIMHKKTQSLIKKDSLFKKSHFVNVKNASERAI